MNRPIRSSVSELDRKRPIRCNPNLTDFELLTFDFLFETSGFGFPAETTFQVLKSLFQNFWGQKVRVGTNLDFDEFTRYMIFNIFHENSHYQTCYFQENRENHK